MLQISTEEWAHHYGSLMLKLDDAQKALRELGYTTTGIALRSELGDIHNLIGDALTLMRSMSF